jgi:hypothetical protein
MGYTIDAAGNIIQTSNTGVVGSNFIPNVYEQPIGALNSVGRQMYTENEDGTVTAPTYSLTSNTPTFDIGSMASIYGTKYMPMFEWVSQKQTGSVTFDPQEGSIGSDEIQDQIEEFTNEMGMTPQEALKKQQEEMLKAEVKSTVGLVASNVGQNLGRAVAAGGGVGDLNIIKHVERWQRRADSASSPRIKTCKIYKRSKIMMQLLKPLILVKH